MTVALGLVVGFLALRFVRVGARGILESVVLQRPNYRERYLPTGAGVLLAVALLGIEGVRSVLGTLEVGRAGGITPARALVLLAVCGYGLLGFLDDVVGGEERGFLGHGRALVRGRLSTGGAKLVAGGALGLVLASATGTASTGRLALDAVVIALGANLGNLLDRAPGRAIKGAVIAYVPLAVVAGTGAAGVALAPVMGAALALFPDDVREHLMLGDAGANALGAALGTAAVLVLAPSTRTLVALVLLGANVMAEVVSFSRVIERVPPLRALDRWGRSHR